jgi:hypothetical protein
LVTAVLCWPYGARRGQLAELMSCGEPVVLDVDAIYRDPLA